LNNETNLHHLTSHSMPRYCTT